MRRIGPWVLGAGMALVVAGIASSALDAWGPVQGEGEHVFALGDGAEVDIGQTRIDSIVLDVRDDAVLRYTLQRLAEAEEVAQRVAWRPDGEVSVLDAQLGYSVARDVELQIPLGMSRLAGWSLSVEAKAPVRSLRVEGSNVSWKGNAGTLTLHAVPLRTSQCGDLREVSVIGFDEGEVGELHIVSAQGAVRLGDLSQVAEIDLRLGPDVRIQLERAADLERIRILPYEGDAPVASVDGQGSAAARAACAAMRIR